MSQRWRAVGNTVSDLTGPRFEPQTSCSRDKRVIQASFKKYHSGRETWAKLRPTKVTKYYLFNRPEIWLWSQFSGIPLQKRIRYLYVNWQFFTDDLLNLFLVLTTCFVILTVLRRSVQLVCEAHLFVIAHVQHGVVAFEEMSQRWRVIGDVVFHLTGRRRSQFQISSRSNRTQCCQRLATVATFLRKVLCRLGPMTRRRA